MALVVPGVARFSVNQSLEGRAVVNVLDYFIDTTGSTMSRAEAVEGQAESIIEQWVQQILPWQVNDLTLESVSYVDLDEADGTTGDVQTSGAVTLPQAGGNPDAPLPANVSALVTKQVTAARGRRNGRMFWAGIPYTAIDGANGNQLASANVPVFNADWADFLANTNELDGVGTAFSSNMAVVHVTARDSAGNPVLGTHALVQSLNVQSLLATQRRRLRG